jgi:hypothetical protein
VTVVSLKDRSYTMLTRDKISLVTHMDLKALNVKHLVCYALRLILEVLAEFTDVITLY